MAGRPKKTAASISTEEATLGLRHSLTSSVSTEGAPVSHELGQFQDWCADCHKAEDVPPARPSVEVPHEVLTYLAAMSLTDPIARRLYDAWAPALPHG